jgi:hypothetical protein
VVLTAKIYYNSLVSVHIWIIRKKKDWIKRNPLCSVPPIRSHTEPIHPL